uniref:Glutathione S-transferase 1, isoform C n=1 Tax=Parasteatoda tepidariorum TaxID=114398 RepID=A0A2L2Z3D1_PARTP
MPVDVYKAPVSAPCRAVLMNAKMIGLDVNKKHVILAGGELLMPEYIRMNPQLAVPTIDDYGVYLWESRAICAYLVNKYSPDSPLYPKDP